MSCITDHVSINFTKNCVAVTFDSRRLAPSTSDIVVLNASDLGDLSRRMIRTRKEQPDAPAFADIHIAIADEASTARGALSATRVAVPANRLVYVGTPLGLVGLLRDINTLGLADGVFLKPLLTAQLHLVRNRVLPLLRAQMPGFRADLMGDADNEAAHQENP